MPTRHGIPLRWAFEETDGKMIYRRNQEFLAFLMRTRALRFVTIDSYLNQRKNEI